MRLVYLGTPEAAVAPLRALVAAGHSVEMVVTQPDRRRGRGSETTPSPVKAAAVGLGLPVVHQVTEAVPLEVDLGVVVAFGQLVKADVLERLPMVNLHFSLLPRWRGAAPVERAILAGDGETGVCLMQLDPGLDTGPVHGCTSTPIGPEETAEQLRARLVDLGTALLLDHLDRGLGEPVPQRGEPTYAAKITTHDLRIDWAQPAEVVLRTVRLGRAWTTFRGRRLAVVTAAVADPEVTGTTEPGQIRAAAGRLVAGCGAGTELVLHQVRAEGRAAQDGAAWARGQRLSPDERLGS